MYGYPRKVVERNLDLYKNIVINKILELTSDGTDLERVLNSRTLLVYAGHMINYARELKRLDEEEKK